ncbi:MAG TPA: hypothetical protein VMY34_11745, partial [Acidimicrobiales bacterium]|nr:hypothetical protein [Acidimicrobiales bacterium]
GAKGSRTSQAGLAPSRGTYTYPAGNARLNGADVFRTAIGATANDTYWRVDWNSLVDRTIPIAAFAIDLDANPATGMSAWPAGAGLRSPGNDAFLVVSSAGATLTTTTSTTSLPVDVDMASRSFVARVPRTALDPSGTSEVRLASGLAGPGGATFAPVPIERGALPGQPAVYNLAFRSYADEPSSQNFWFENSQAEALATGSAPFKASVDFPALAAGTTEPEPQPTGWSNRWYVSSIELGQGVVADAGGGTGDVKPNYLGRVQPYGVFVPTTYDAGNPTPLTWVLHSLSVMHNQYSAISPELLEQACEARGSICATPLGRGPDMWYVEEGELDFWEVWHDLADHFTLDSERTVISGYSMGGYGTYRLGLSYPDVFAKLVALAGPPACGLRVNRQVGGAAESSAAGVCSKDGDTTALLPNTRWTPVYVAHGALDELVPVTSVLEHVGELDKLGYRHHFKLFPAEDHMGYSLQDGFSQAAASMVGAVREQDPGLVSLTFYPHASRSDYGLGATGAWWVRAPKGRDVAPGVLARVDARSDARTEGAVTTVRTKTASVPGDPTPSIDQDLSWTLGAAPASASRIDIGLTNVVAVDVDTVGAGIPTGSSMVVTVTSLDGASTVRLTGLAPGTAVLHDVGGLFTLAATADVNGIASLAISQGRSTFVI